MCRGLAVKIGGLGVWGFGGLGVWGFGGLGVWGSRVEGLGLRVFRVSRSGSQVCKFKIGLGVWGFRGLGVYGLGFGV